MKLTLLLLFFRCLLFSSLLFQIMTHAIEAESMMEDSSMASPPSQMSVGALETQNALLQIRSRALTFCKNVISSQGEF